MDYNEIQKQKFYEMATSILQKTKYRNSLLLNTKTNGHEASVWFFQTTSGGLDFIQLNIFPFQMTRLRFLCEEHYDEKTNSIFLYSLNVTSEDNFIVKSMTPFQLHFIVTSNYWPYFKRYDQFILYKSRHLSNCVKENTNDDLLIQKNGYFCSSCEELLQFEVLPNINKKTVELWSLWDSKEFFIEWIPEEVIKEIFDFVCE
jgi:hypothetical protein